MSPSPAPKYRLKEKKVTKDIKESQKNSTKVSGPSSYPPLGASHALDPAPKSYASSLQANGRSRNADGSEDYARCSNANGTDCDSISNNDTCSVESDDQKEKSSSRQIRQEPVPGADIDKRDKTRQKNERKHQRQKERRAQDLQERCSGYLMSRKLEMLAHQLVSMGFSSDRATMALMLNEGRMEESVTWLFEGHDGSENLIDEEILNSSNLKIDISEELAQMEEMGINLKCSKQEVERVVVSCEGDLSKVTEVLKSQMQKHNETTVPKSEEIVNPPSLNSSRNLANSSENIEGSQFHNNLSSSSSQITQSANDITYPRITVTGAPPGVGSKHHQQPCRKIQSKMERPNAPLTPNLPSRSWGSTGTNTSVYRPPSVSSHGAAVLSDMNMGHLNTENERNARESAGLIQQLRSTDLQQLLSPSMGPSPPGTSPGWQLKVSPNPKSLRLLPQTSNTRSITPNSRSPTQFYQRLHDQPRQVVPGVDSSGMSPGSGLLSRNSVPPTLSAVSSLGLFSGPGSSSSAGLSPLSEWIDGGTSCSLDYNRIDWSLDNGLPLLNRDGSPFGKSLVKNSHLHKLHVPGLGIRPASAMTHTSWNGVPISGYKNVVANTEDFSMLGSRFVSPPRRVKEDSE